ncbi:MAG: hypothetical protein IE891_08420 [Flavobacteriaceae bacterium]|nr:hypothetical protein [Flavobacteriaceae bacterium]
MSLFEWLGEYFNPKNIGEITKETPPRVNKPKFKIYIHFVISILLIIGYYYLWLNNDTNFNLKKIIIITILLIVYLSITYNYKVKPDYNNIGLFGTPIDHPFRISDDINRFLIFFEIFLFPGRYISTSIVSFVLKFRH